MSLDPRHFGEMMASTAVNKIRPGKPRSSPGLFVSLA
jgi:hypothetical protein